MATLAETLTAQQQVLQDKLTNANLVITDVQAKLATLQADQVELAALLADDVDLLKVEIANYQILALAAKYIM